MKKIYFAFLLLNITLLATAQNNTAPTGTSTEVGVTNGELSVSLDGSASYSIPILTPPGINNFEPQISINYNSHQVLQSSAAATSWYIGGISSITRIPATKFHDGKIDPVDFNSLDRFALDGQRLIVKNGTTGIYGADKTEYETEYYSNTKITSYGVHPSGAGYGPAYFLVEYPNGTKAYFGNSTDSRSVMEWSITYIENPQGNRISYTYTLENNLLYPSSIKYGGLTTSTPINEIKFVYVLRNVSENFYVGGVNMKRDKKLTAINVLSNNTGFRNYTFEPYGDNIKSVTEKNGDNTKSYNPTVFDYQGTANPITYNKGNNTVDISSISSLNAATVSGDFDGDGNMDFILYPTNGSYAKAKCWIFTDANPSTPFSMSLPQNTGAFDDIFASTYINSAGQLASNQGWTLAKGNLFTTFYLTSTLQILQNDQKVFTFPRFILDYQYQCNGVNPDLIENSVLRQPVDPNPTGPIDVHYESDIPRRFISGDFNGDGITDIIAIEKSFTYPYRYMCTQYTSTYQGGRSFFINLDKRLTTNFATVMGSMETTNESDIRTGDFNGDGKADIYVFDSNSLKIYGLNDSNQIILLAQKTGDTDILLSKPIAMGDYNGDGKTDVLIPKAYNISTWYKFTSTGNSLLKTETSGPIFLANTPYRTYNYIPVDFNNDRKTDLIQSTSYRSTNDTVGGVSIYLSINNSNGFSSVGTNWASTNDQPDVNIYALPVYLPTSQQTLRNGAYTTASTLQVAFLNQNKIHFFSGDDDLQKNSLLKKITTGNGVQEAITYIPLNSLYKNTYNTIYTPSLATATYPNFDIKTDHSFFVVSKIEQTSKSVYRKRWFGYYGAVSNVEGIGFLGFRSVTQTNWHDDSSKIFTDIYKNDVDLRGTTKENASVPYLSYPYAGALPSDYVTKSVTTYSNTTENPLQTNKVFKLKPTNIKQSNTLNDTSSETKDLVYDTNNNIKSSTTISNTGTSLSQTIKTDIAYETATSSPFYIVGRPANKLETVTSDGHTMTSKEIYTYNTKQLLTNIERSGTGTDAISESNEYDSYGNVTKKTITPALPLLARATKYEYDTTKRFVTKITDNDDLVTSLEYYPTGLLKKETDPYLLSKSYTYDSWFKNLTITDDQLKSIITSSYSRDSEKTVITTTVSATGLDTTASEETLDDLGRTIKSGTKDLNGNFSYTSYLYDIYDRNFKVSEPYFGSAATQWNEVKFDDYGRSKQTTAFNTRTTSTSYTPASLKAVFTDGAKSKTITQNAAGNTTSTNENIGGDITYNYFANGSLRKAIYNGLTIEMEQDGWGNKTKLKDPIAGTYNYSYNTLGELITETIDGTGITTTITRDKSGKPTKKTIIGTGYGTDVEISYTYDGNLPLTVKYVDKNEPTATNTTLTTITYDSSKRISSIVEGRTGVSKFTKSFTYDNLNRIVTETKLAELGLKKSEVKTRNTYKNGILYQILEDATSKVLWQANTLNAKGEILESISGNGLKMTNAYDSDGYLRTIKYDKNTTPAVNLMTLTTVFDKNTDNLTSRTNSAFGNYNETFEYDDLDRLTKFTNKSGGQEAQTYDASGKILSNNLGTYDYDLTKKYQNTAINLSTEAAGYFSNREGIFNDSMESRTGWSLGAYNPQCISFDNTKSHTGKNSVKINTVSSGVTVSYVQSDVSIPINNIADTQYTFSGWVYTDSPKAQLTLFQYKANETGSYTYVNSTNTTTLNNWIPIQMTVLVPASIKSLRLRLDVVGSGNVWFDDVEIRKTTDPTSSERKLNITYNAFKSPIQIEETNVDKVSFTYNSDNQRSLMYYGGFQIDKLLRPLRKHYSADGSMEIKQNTTTGAVEFITYIGGDGYSAPVAVKSDGTTPNYLYLHRDYQGTISAVTDANGAIVEKRLFDAWGSIIKVQDGTGNVLNGLTILDRGYTGHEHLQSVGLINMNARLYDPLLHRFLQTDNFVQDVTSTQNFNPYGYVFNNPLKYIDPSGDICEGCGGAPGVDGGGGTGTSTDLKQFGKDTGIDQWMRDNLNFENWDRARKDFFNLRNRFGGKKENRPPPNMSRYSNVATTGSGQFYGGDGSGSFMDYFSRFVYETDQFNPLALAWDGIKGNLSGTDRYGNKLSGFDSNLKIVSAIPVTKVASIATGASMKGISLLTSKTITSGQLIERAAVKAEVAIGGKGAIAGISKHKYAMDLLKRYERRFGSRGFQYNFYFNSKTGRGFLDIYDRTNGRIYDFKFGKAFMSKAQYNKYSITFFGSEIFIIRP